MLIDRIPILKMGDFLLVTIQGELQDSQAVTLQQELTARVAEVSARGVLMEISGLALVDSYMGRMISTIAAMTRMLDAETVVVGMQPAMAITLVEMGLTLPGVLTAMNVERGMELLRSRLGLPGDNGDSSDQLR
jgi:rsbT antagonist protein RsbS